MSVEFFDKIKFKKCLLFLILFTVTFFVVLNVMFTCWIIHVLKLSPNGIQNMMFSSNTTFLNNSVYVNGTVLASNIKGSTKDLNIRGNKTLQLNVGKSGIQIEDNQIKFKGDNFVIEDSDGYSFLNFTKNSLTTAIEKVIIRGNANVLKALQAEEIKSHTNSDLKLVSRTKRVKIESQKTFTAYAPGGNIELMCHLDTILHSKRQIKLEAEEIFLPKLPSSRPDLKHTIPFQLCICSDGKLFTAHPRSNCYRGSDKICDLNKSNKD